MMSGSADIAAGVLPSVLSAYKLGQAQSIAPAGFGLSNHNYLVDTGRGGYVVKFLVNQTPLTIENDVAIQRQLRAAGIMAPEYLRHRDDEYIYRKGSISAVVSKRIDGDTPRHMSAPLASDIGRHLALFHISVRTLPHANLTGLMNPGVARVNPDAAAALLEQSLPRGIVHGDLHGGNVLVDALHQDRVNAILDFEEAGENLYLIDLAVTLMASGAPQGGEELELELMRATMRGYESVRVLTDQERAWLPCAIRYASDAWINWFKDNGFERYARQHERRYASFERIAVDHLPL